MAESVCHEFGDHKLRRVDLQAPPLQRASGEVPGGLGRLRHRGQLTDGEGPIHQAAGGEIRQGQRPTLGLGPVMPACREEPVVAHTSALHPYRRNELRVTRLPCNLMRSGLGVPQCKRYHPPCILQAQDPMHVHPVLWRAWPVPRPRRRHQADRGFRRGLT